MTDRKRVLVADDDEFWRNEVRKVVEGCGHVVTETESASGAEKLLDARPFDLLITDNQMEVRDAGIQLLKRNWYLRKEIPSILHTSFLTRVEERELAAELPAVIRVIKSTMCDHSKLTAAIQELLA